MNLKDVIICEVCLEPKKKFEVDGTGICYSCNSHLDEAIVKLKKEGEKDERANILFKRWKNN